MPQQPKLRKKRVGQSTYWYTEAGGATYFGNVDVVPFKEARSLFNDHVRNLADGAKDSKERRRTAGELMDIFLAWVSENRCSRSYQTRTTACSRFGAFEVGQQKIRDLPANRIKSDDLAAFLSHLDKDLGLGAQTRRHYETSIKHCWNWATKHPSPVSYLPPSYRPFAAVERTRVPPKRLTEDDLLNDAEIAALFAAAEIDLDEFHRFGPKVPRQANPYGSFADMLRCYYHTGARTGELAACLVEDVLFRTGQVVLGKHKRSQTQREPTLRHITLNDEALEIFRRRCHSKEKTEPVFVNSDGRSWTGSLLPKRFDRVKEVARRKKLGVVRDGITIYAFRHLWISEMLMEGNDIATVAKMAGTSISMIERVYGHFRNKHLREAQDKLDRARRRRKTIPVEGA
jgi:integrase